MEVVDFGRWRFVGIAMTFTVEGFIEFDPWSRKSIDGPRVFELQLVH